MIAFLIGYWLSHSRYHESIDSAGKKSLNWWQRLFNRSKPGSSSKEESNFIQS
jgi:hypothetical protein